MSDELSKAWAEYLKKFRWDVDCPADPVPFSYGFYRAGYRAAESRLRAAMVAAWEAGCLFEAAFAAGDGYDDNGDGPPPDRDAFIDSYMKGP